jgi:phage recombination protein Bet
MGNRYGLDPGKIYETLCKTAFAGAQNQEQVIALLVVADQYRLNPFTKEIYAFPAKGGGVIPMVSIDGWLRIINEHPQFDGMEFRESDDRITVGKSNPAPEWMECIIYRKDRSHPIVAREYLQEVYRDTAPWNQTTARFLRHRCIMQCARLAFGFGGIMDPNDADFAVDFDYEGVAIEEPPAARPIGKRDWKKLLEQAKRFGYTEADIMATAATAGHEGEGHEIPADLADKLFLAMRDHPKVQDAEFSAQDAETVDPETGELVEPEPVRSGYRTPFAEGCDD